MVFDTRRDKYEQVGRGLTEKSLIIIFVTLVFIGVGAKTVRYVLLLLLLLS